MDIRINRNNVVLGPATKQLNQRLNQEVFLNPESQSLIAAVRGLLTQSVQGLNPNATASLQLILTSDGSSVRVMVDFTATGVNQ